MPSTTVHFPPPLLERVDVGAWPQGFFAPDLTEDELALLRAAGADLEQSILSTRRNRGAAVISVLDTTALSAAMRRSHGAEEGLACRHWR